MELSFRRLKTMPILRTWFGCLRRLIGDPHGQTLTDLNDRLPRLRQVQPFAITLVFEEPLAPVDFLGSKIHKPGSEHLGEELGWSLAVSKRGSWILNTSFEVIVSRWNGKLRPRASTTNIRLNGICIPSCMCPWNMNASCCITLDRTSGSIN